MKARVKATGEIVDVINYSGFDNYDYYEPERKLPWLKHQLDFNVLGGETPSVAQLVAMMGKQVEKALSNKPDPDYWTRLEHRAAIAAMQGILSNPNIVYKDISMETICNHVAERVKEIAHALVEKYKKEEK